MNRIPFLPLVAVGSLLVGCSDHQITGPASGRTVASVPRLSAQTGCQHISGAFVFTRFQFTSQTTAVGDGRVEGDLAGEFHAEYFDIEQRGAGVIKMRAHHTITSAAGMIRTSDEILLLPDQDPAVARPNSRLDVIGGTGVYAGATGLLHTHGRVDLATLGGAIEFKGQVCVP
jgi:hypothetical protein